MSSSRLGWAGMSRSCLCTPMRMGIYTVSVSLRGAKSRHGMEWHGMPWLAYLRRKETAKHTNPWERRYVGSFLFVLVTAPLHTGVVQLGNGS